MSGEVNIDPTGCTPSINAAIKQFGVMSDHFQFCGAGADPGLEVFRLESRVPMPWPKEMYGRFHEGDCYILLRSDRGLQSPANRALTYSLHFWLGKDSTPEARAAAAQKTSELDDSLVRGTPVQHREIQEYESSLFLSYFHMGIEYLPGGFDSPRPLVGQPFELRMLCIKGLHRMRAKMVKPHASSLSENAIFLLDTGPVIYQWNGKAVSQKSITRAMDFSVRLRMERGDNASVIL
eukprot:SAG31_NODE_1120_length_9805_cov_8.220173_7_plen_236_part_00